MRHEQQRGEGISIHTPLAGSDLRLAGSFQRFEQFQSTLPLRGATDHRKSFYGKAMIISIHTPLAGSDVKVRLLCATFYISIHTPLAGSDRSVITINPSHQYFNPHSPCGERLLIPGHPSSRSDFNPHSPCGERRTSGECPRPLKYFNPHSPCGERLWRCQKVWTLAVFQSTLPLRGATCPISRPCSWPIYFNPHSPCGERLDRSPRRKLQHSISIHTPLAGSDVR